MTLTDMVILFVVFVLALGALMYWGFEAAGL